MQNDTHIKKFNSEKVKTARKAAGLSRAGLGKLAGRTSMSIYCWETGRAEPNAQSLALLSVALNQPMEFFYE